jgi:hypothetical protein
MIRNSYRTYRENNQGLVVRRYWKILYTAALRFGVGYGGGIDHKDIGIENRDSFEKESDGDEFWKTLEHIVFVTAVSPIATMTMRRNLYQSLSISDKTTADKYFSDTPHQCMGKDLVTVITLALVWSAVTRDRTFATDNLPAITFMDFFEVAKLGSDLVGFDEMRRGIGEINNEGKVSIWQNLEIHEAREIFEKMVLRASEFSIFSFVETWRAHNPR